MTADARPARLRLASSPSAPLGAGALVVLLAAALVPLAIAAGHDLLTAGEGIAITIPFAAVGVLVARRQPGNVIGWLMIIPAAGRGGSRCCPC